MLHGYIRLRLYRHNKLHIFSLTDRDPVRRPLKSLGLSLRSLHKDTLPLNKVCRVEYFTAARILPVKSNNN